MTQWPNLANSNNNFTENTGRYTIYGGPTVQVDSNSNKVIRFHQNSLKADSNILSSATNTQGIEIWAVASNNATNFDSHFLIDTGEAQNSGYGVTITKRVTSGESRIGVYTPISFGGTTNEVYVDFSTEYMIIRVRIQFGVNMTIKVDDTETSVSNPGLTSLSSSTVYGGAGTILGMQSKSYRYSDRYFTGDLGAMIIYDTLLTSSEATELETYLRNRWIPPSLPPPSPVHPPPS